MFYLFLTWGYGFFGIFDSKALALPVLKFSFNYPVFNTMKGYYGDSTVWIDYLLY